MFRGKLLYLYFPDKFLNVFAEDDINFFLERLGIEYLPEEHIIHKQEKLILYKESSKEMFGWSNSKFGYFLYNQFVPPSKSNPKSFLPKENKTGEDKAIYAEEGVYVLPNIEKVQLGLISLADIILPKKTTKTFVKKRKFKGDYIAESIRNKKLGDQGEEIVMKYEKQLLINAKQNKLEDKVERVSLKDDSVGYDIQSFTITGEPKYIEVKATKSGVDKNTPFFISENERLTLEQNKDKYYIYRVFSANTTSPKLLIIDKDILKNEFTMTSKVWQVSLN